MINSFEQCEHISKQRLPVLQENPSSSAIPNSSSNVTEEKLATHLEVDEDGSVSSASEVSFTLIDGSKERTKASKKS